MSRQAATEGWKRQRALQAAAEASRRRRRRAESSSDARGKRQRQESIHDHDNDSKQGAVNISKKDVTPMINRPFELNAHAACRVSRRICHWLWSGRKGSQQHWM
jgi:hypothetical protein